MRSQPPKNVSDQSIRKAGVIAGASLVLMTVVSVYAYVVVIEGVFVEGDAARTAANIAESGVFRLATALLLLVAFLDIIVAWALRVVFAPVSEIIANLAAAVRVAYAAVLVVAVGYLAVASSLVGGPGSETGLSVGDAQAQALLQMDLFNAVFAAGLALVGFHLLLLAYLIIRSSYVPTILGVLLVPAGSGYLIDTFGTFLVADYSVSVAAFTGFTEAFLALWLLFRARRIRSDSSELPDVNDDVRSRRHKAPLTATAPALDASA